MTDTTPDITLTEDLQELLTDAESVEQQYQEFYTWMIEEGKNPRREMGLGGKTAKNYLDRLDQLHRFALLYLNPDDETTIASDDADKLLLLIDRGDITQQRGATNNNEYGESTKRKFSDTLKKYFSWRYYEGERTAEWTPKINFSDGNGESAYRFTHRELGLLLETAEGYGSLPSYFEASAEERDKISGLIAQRLSLMKEEVTQNDWIVADRSTKVYSLVTAGYDAGLAPIEIERAKVRWYDPKTKTLTIPSEDACKERDKERVALSDETTDALSEWIQERRHLKAYDGTNQLWLNREGNPYQSGSLCNLLRSICTEADIKTDGRKVVWYSLRQTMGRNVTAEGELSEANDQLRHNRLETTQENYNTTPVEKLQASLNETHRMASKSASDPSYNPYEDEPQDDAHQTTGQSGSQTETSDTSDIVTQTGNGTIHADGVFPNTHEAKVDVTSQILNSEED